MILTEEQQDKLKKLAEDKVKADEDHAIKEVIESFLAFIKESPEVRTDPGRMVELLGQVYHKGFMAGIALGVSTAAEAAAMLLENIKK